MTQNRTAENRGGLPTLLIPLLWASLVFFSYFTFKTHPLSQVLPFMRKLFDLGSFPAEGGEFWRVQAVSLRILLTSSLLILGTWGLGRGFRRWIQLKLEDKWTRFAFDFGLGQCGLGLFWLGTGLTGLWFKPVGLTAWAILLLLSFLELGRDFRRRESLSPAEGFPRGGFLFLWLIGLFYLFFSLAQNLAPETFYDSMVYHLAVPQNWLLRHGITDLPANFFSNYPYGAELYFLNGLFFQGTESAKILHEASWVACALLAGGWAREMGGRQAGWMALGLTLTLPLFTVNVWTSQVEGFLSLAVVLFIYALNRFAGSGDNRLVWACLAGLFLGLALSTKYTALLPAGSALLVLAFQYPSLLRKGNGKFWLAMGLGSLLLAGPWILKNLVFTGNPFFPYLMSLFHGRHLPPGGYERLLQEQHARVTTGGWSWLALPWTLTMANPDSYNFCGPLSLALVPFLFLFRLRHPALRFLAWVAPLFLATGLALTHILRFVLPVFVLLNILLGAVLAGGNRPAWGRGVAWISGLSAVLCFGYLGAISHYYYSAAGIWSGRETRAQYLAGPGKITPYYPMTRWISDNTPSDARLLIAGDARGLYYDRPFITNTVFDEQVLAGLAKREKDAEGMARRLRQMGVDYLVVNGPEGIRVSPDYHHYDLTREEWQRLDTLIQRGTELVYLRNFQSVYRLLPAFHPPPPVETADLLLFFSKPGSEFIQDVRGRDIQGAKEDLGRALELYPFSKTWQSQMGDLETEVRGGRHG